MVLPVTAIATVILGAWYVVLTARVVDARRSAGVSLGDGGDERLTRRMRGQGNFVENVPIALLVLAVAEMQTVTTAPTLFTAVLAVAATALVAGRILHGVAFCFSDQWIFGRMVGMILTFLSMIALVLLAALALVL